MTDLRASCLSLSRLPSLNCSFTQPETSEAAVAVLRPRRKRALRGGFAVLALLAGVCLGAMTARAATYTVTSNGDSGAGSLRSAIVGAGNGDTLDASGVNGTITLQSTLTISNSITIIGPGANHLTISGPSNGNFSLFTIGSGSTVQISGLTIANPSVQFSSEGAAINNSGTLTVQNSTFAGNSSSGGAGGAIASFGPLTVQNSTFTGNSNLGGGGGGAIYSYGQLTVQNSTFAWNTATCNSTCDGGGAIDSHSTLTVQNSTFTRNIASAGGAIASYGPLTVQNSTFTSNGAQNSHLGGGILFTAAISVVNSIVSGNVAGGAPNDIDEYGSVASADQGGNVLGYVYASDVLVGTPNTAPLNLSPLGNYGGPTQTIFPLPGSPAICAGLASIDSANGIASDQRGDQLDTTCPAGSNYVDAGAVQANWLTVTTLDDSTNSGTSCTGGAACSLRDALGIANEQTTNIDFQLPGQAPWSIQLSSTLEIGTDVNIPGPGANQLTINGGGPSSNFSVFTVDSGVTASISGLTIANGNSSGSGGGIDNNGTLAVSNSAFTGNHAAGSGGGIANDLVSDTWMTVTNSTFVGNSADSAGGGISNKGWGWLTVTNSTFVGNSANSAGGISNISTSVGLTAIHSTFSGNSAIQQNDGGAISDSNINGTTIYNSIFSGNTAGGSADDTTSTVNGAGNLLGAIVSLSPLGIYGGPTQTMVPLPGSSAICGGSASAVPAGLTTDQRGYPRINTTYTGYTSPNPACVDAGAVQTNYTTVTYVQEPPSTVTTGQHFSLPPEVEVRETNTNMPSGVWPPNFDAVNGIPITITTGSATLNENTFTATSSGEYGYASFNNLVAGADGQYTLATEPITITPNSEAVLASVSSDPFSVIGVTQLAVSAPPTAMAGVPFNVTVTGQDASGNPVTDYTGTVQLAANYRLSSVLGTYSVTSGTRTYQITLGTVGTPTITAIDTSDSSITGTSGSITVSAGAPSQIAATGGSGQSAVVGMAFAQPLQAMVTDADSNPVSGVLVTFTATPNPNNGASAVFANGSNTATTDGNGIASVSAPTTNSIAGNYTVTASAGALTPASFSLTNSPIPMYVVTNALDAVDANPDCSSGNGSTCSLRDALAVANATGAGSITFAPVAFATAQTIQLGSGLTVSGNVSIAGPTTGSGATLTNLVTLSGCNPPIGSINPTAAQGLVCTGEAQFFSIFTVSSGSTVTIAGLNIGNGIVLTTPGGGINNSGNLTLTGTTFLNNLTFESGGAIFNAASGVVQAAASTFLSNGAFGNGGAIENLGALTVTGSTFGGLFSQAQGDTNQSNIAAISGGGSPGGGGAIANESGASLSVIDSTFWNNNAAWGGAIHNNGTLHLYSSTVSGNSAINANGAGGIDCNFDNTSGQQTAPCTSMTISNSLVAWNQSGSGLGGTDDIEDGNGAGNYMGAGGNIVTVYNTAPATFYSSPLSLATLGNYGGALQTLIPLPGNPAICAGVYANIPSGTTTDQRGYPNSNSTYPGFTSASPCVDAGAVQTNYSMAFSTQPPASVQEGIPFAADLALSESGAPFTDTYGVSASVALNPATGSSSPWSVTFVTGVASYSGFNTNRPGHNDTMIATLPLNASLALSATSSSIDVFGQPSRIAVALSSAPPVIAGTPANYTATAYDSVGNVVTNDSDAIGITTTDPAMQFNIPGAVLTNGTVTFPVTLKTAGMQTLTVIEDTYGMSGTTNNIAVNPGPATQLTLSGVPANATAGSPFSVTVTAQDAYGNTTPSYTGTVKFTSTDTGTQTVLPPPYAFQSGTGMDNGVHVFANGVTLTTAGTQHVTVADTANASMTSTASTSVAQAANPVPSIGTLLPAFASRGGATFTLTVNGSGFTGNSTVYWGSSALATQYLSSIQITAQVPATDLAVAGVTAITVQTPAPGGGASHSLQFEVDSAPSGTTPPTFTTVTATVAPGSTASYPVTLPSSATSITVMCLNLPSGATCAYSASTGAITIATTAATPSGTYQATVVFTETVPNTSTAFVLLPILLLPLLFIRRKLAARGIFLTACIGLVLVSVLAFNTGCGGKSGGGTAPPQTQRVTSSGAVTLIVQ
ncbi:MAG: choice-of-anchor Q domain-containing protein [Terracidiphilus sp.]